MGVLASLPTDPSVGRADAIGGFAAFSVAFNAGTLRSDFPSTLAHELGHNLGLQHAPLPDTPPLPPARCLPSVRGVDGRFPHNGGRIGAWGYSVTYDTLVAPYDTLVAPTYFDLMSYCEPQWISSYHFKKAFDFRWQHQGVGAPAVASGVSGRALLLWGGIGPDSSLRLNPAFVLNARPRLPAAGGAYEITGRSADGETLFALSFAMTEIADGPEGESHFAFTVPVRSEWEGRLSSIHLRGPRDSVTLDADSDSPMKLVMDPVTGVLREVVRDMTLAEVAEAAEMHVAGAGANPRVYFSRGLPNELRREP